MRTRSAAWLAALIVSLAVPRAVQADPFPPDRRDLPSPGVSAPGVDVACVPDAHHPSPVILIHGTRADRTINWPYLGPELAEVGYCVFSLDLPDRGQAPLDRSLAALVTRVDEVIQATGAGSVSLVGHSLGGLVARDFVRRGGGEQLVDDVVALGTPHYGYYTEPPGDQIDAAFNTGCPACYEMAQGSDYMNALNSDPVPGRASYTTLITTYDGVALPLENQYLPEGPRVANVLLQEACPDHIIDHNSLALDPLVRDWILDALAREGPADRGRAVDCQPGL